MKQDCYSYDFTSGGFNCTEEPGTRVCVRAKPVVLTVALSLTLLGVVLPDPIQRVFLSDALGRPCRVPSPFFFPIHVGKFESIIGLLFKTGVWDSTCKRFIHPSKCDPQNPDPRAARFMCADVYADFITEPSHWAQSGTSRSLEEWSLKTSKQLLEPPQSGQGSSEQHPLTTGIVGSPSCLPKRDLQAWTALLPLKKPTFSLVFTQTKGLH